jgi:hypothetical protein
MTGRNGGDGGPDLRVDVIDEQGRVLDTVYIGEISQIPRRDETPPPSLRTDRRQST